MYSARLLLWMWASLCHAHARKTTSTALAVHRRRPCSALSPVKLLLCNYMIFLQGPNSVWPTARQLTPKSDAFSLMVSTWIQQPAASISFMETNSVRPRADCIMENAKARRGAGLVGCSRRFTEMNSVSVSELCTYAAYYFHCSRDVCSCIWCADRVEA